MFSRHFVSLMSDKIGRAGCYNKLIKSTFLHRHSRNEQTTLNFRYNIGQSHANSHIVGWVSQRFTTHFALAINVATFPRHAEKHGRIQNNCCIPLHPPPN